MSNYTPTTEHVRQVFQMDPNRAMTQREQGKAFDRWLADEIEKAVIRGYTRALRTAAHEAANYTGHPYNAAVTLALGFTMAADEIEEGL